MRTNARVTGEIVRNEGTDDCIIVSYGMTGPACHNIVSTSRADQENTVYLWAYNLVPNSGLSSRKPLNKERSRRPMLMRSA